MNDLIARLEAATPERQSTVLFDALRFALQNDWISYDAYHRAADWVMRRAYESAALTLVPDEWDWSIDDEPCRRRHPTSLTKAAYASCGANMGSPKFPYYDGRHNLPAIAISIAALKAWAVLAENRGK